MGLGFFVLGVGWRNRPGGPTACCARLRNIAMLGDDGGGDAGSDAAFTVVQQASFAFY